MFLEVFAKERLVGEIHLFGYLFDALGGALHHEHAAALRTINFILSSLVV